MAYKFHLGEHKLPSGASIDTSGAGADIILGDNQVDSTNLNSAISLDKLRNSASNPTLSIKHAQDLPSNDQVISFTYNGDTYTITAKSANAANQTKKLTLASGTRGAGASFVADVHISVGGSAYGGNNAGADSFYGDIATILNSDEALSASFTAGTDILLITGLLGKTIFADNSTSFINRSGSGDEGFDASAAADAFVQLTNGGFEAKTSTQMRSELGLSAAAIKTVGISDDNLLEVDGDPGTGEYARFTANGIEGLTAAELKAALDLEIGTDIQAQNARLVDVAGLAVTDGSFIVGDGTNFVLKSPAQSKTSLSLNNVDNTSDTNKPVSTATTTQLNLKATVDSAAFTGTSTFGTNKGSIAAAGNNMVLATVGNNGHISMAPHGNGVVKVTYASTATIDGDTLVPKSYVDAQSQGLSVKDAVKVASDTSADLNGLDYSANSGVPSTLSYGNVSGENILGFFDGEQANTVGDRVLIKNFSGADGYKNGIYEVTTAASGLVRSKLVITFAGSGGGDAADTNDSGDIQFILNQKLFKIQLTDLNAVASGGFTSGAGTAASKDVDYTNQPNGNDTLKFSFNGSNYVITFKSSGSTSANFGGGVTADVLISGDDADATYSAAATLISTIAGLSAELSPADDNNNAGTLRINAEVFGNFVDSGDSNNTFPTNASAGGVVAMSPFVMTCGVKDALGYQSLTNLVTKIIGDDTTGLKDLDNGLDTKAGVITQITKLGTNRELQIEESNLSNSISAKDFVVDLQGGNSVSVAKTDFSVGSLTRGVLKRAQRALEDGGLSSGEMQMAPGSFCFVTKGINLKDTGFVLSSDTALTPNVSTGSDLFVFSQFSSAGLQTLSGIGLGTITAGTVSAGEPLVVDSNKAISGLGKISGKMLQEGIKVIAATADRNEAADLVANGSIIVYKFGVNGSSDVANDGTITLPSTAAAGKVAGAILKVKRVEISPNSRSLTIDRNGASIDGVAENIVLAADSTDAAISLICDGTDWYIL